MLATELPTAENAPESRATSSTARPRRVLVVSAAFPSSVDPSRGVFVKQRVRALADLPGYEVRVVAPVPYFPAIKALKAFKHWYALSQVPREEEIDGLTVYHPRYFLPPKVGGYFHPQLMYPSVQRCVERLRRGFDFDLIDAHFVYPAGVVATMLGRRYAKPVVMTGRGEDMLRFPSLQLKGRAIRKAVSRAAHYVALSREIAHAFEAQGARPDRMTVIPNGVDLEKFTEMKRDVARRHLQLPPHTRIVLSVGDLQERKGFHILIDAFSQVRRQHPDAMLLIVGGAAPYGSDFSGEIQRRIRDNSQSDHVRLVGRVAHENLPAWYSAADVFALLSSREGSPNVLLEALACGTPAIATAVGGIPDELVDTDLGILLSQRNVEAAAIVLDEALTRKWDPVGIRRKMLTRSWVQTAMRVHDVFERVVHEALSFPQ